MKKVLSLCMALVLILASTVICSSAETVYDKYDFCYGYDYFLEIGERDGLYKEEDLRFATVNGSQFVYVVNDGEAAILNVRTNFIGPEKTLFVFPTHLGGYPVTTIGSIESGKNVCVFDYCQFLYDVTPENTIGEAETDPGLRYVSGIVIPEGYKNIGNCAFVLVWGMTYYLPDSLERIGIMPFELDSIEVRKPWPNFIFDIEPATDTPYVTYGSRDYKINVTGSPSKIQVVRDNGGTTTIDRRKAQVTSNGDTETWLVNMRVEAGTHNIRAKYGKVWDEKLTPFTVEYDLPGAYSFDLVYENGIGNFDVVTDPEVMKIQFALDNGCTLTYSQTNSYIGEDGLRHWEISRKIPTDRIFILRTKYGYTWTDTNFEVNTII